MMIRLSQFSGVAPGINSAQLPEGMAQVAENCDFSYGDLRPLRGLDPIIDLGDTTLRSLYYFDGEWRAWDRDVDVSRSPIANVSSRTIAFGVTTSGPEEWDENSAVTGLAPTGYLLGIPAPTGTPTATAGAGGGCAVADQTTVSVLYTLVRTWAGVSQEGPPSSATVVDLCEGQNLTLTDFAAPAGNYGITHVRFYGATTSDYLYIAEVAITETSYDWTFSADGFGSDTLPSEGWGPPPATATGLVIKSNGVGVAFDGNELLISVPYQLHAWPDAYRLSTSHPIKALLDIGDEIAVLTTGPQYLLIGDDPEAMSLRRLETYQACPSKRSAADMGSYGIYAGTDGLIAITPTGETRNLTDGIYTPDKWRELIYPASVSGYNWRGSYVAFYFKVTGYTQMTVEDSMESLFDEYTGVPGGFIYNPKFKGVTTLDFAADGGQSIFETLTNGGVQIAQAGMLALLIDGVVESFADENAAYLTADWKSGIYRVTKSVNMGAAQVIADAYPLTFKVYADGVLKHTQTVADADPFRLPSGYRAMDWEFEIITSSGPVRYAAIAETLHELADV